MTRSASCSKCRKFTLTQRSCALTREQKELSAVVETYRAYQKCEDDIVQALELVSDPELKDMAQEELNTAKAEKRAPF